MQRDDGAWMRWDDAGAAWVGPNATRGRRQGPFGTAGVEQVQQRTQATMSAEHRDRIAANSGTTHATWLTDQTQTGQRKPRSNGPLFAIVGGVLVIVAIAVYSMAFSGKDNVGGLGVSGRPGTAAGRTAPPTLTAPALAAPAQAAPGAMACEHTGSGKAYDVGPSQSLDSLGEVPWETLVSGDTVRIQWRAEPYREKFFLRGKGTKDQPIVVCGVAGPAGELPIVDGQNAITRPGLPTPSSGAGEPRGLIHITLGAADPWGYKPQYIVIQGLHIRNAFHENSFTASNGKVLSYAENAAGIFIERGEHIVVRGV
jgi:hypothetical protein